MLHPSIFRHVPVRAYGAPQRVRGDTTAPGAPAARSSRPARSLSRTRLGGFWTPSGPVRGRRRARSGGGRGRRPAPVQGAEEPVEQRFEAGLVRVARGERGPAVGEGGQAGVGLRLERGHGL